MSRNNSVAIRMGSTGFGFSKTTFRLFKSEITERGLRNIVHLQPNKTLLLEF